VITKRFFLFKFGFPAQNVDIKPVCRGGHQVISFYA
jgi:hypothetical protein